MKKKIFIIIFFILGLTQKSFSYSSDPKQFIQEIVDEAKKVLIEANSKVPEIISHPSRAGMVIVEGVSRKDSNNKANTAVNSINFEYF